jgi:cobalt transporter subunit CbtB
MAEEVTATRPLSGVEAGARADTLAAAVCAALFGCVLIWGVGFSHISALHNAAHDTRHSAAFPCH